MGLIGDLFGYDLEKGWNEFWGDPLGETHDFVADKIWDPILDVMGMDDADRKKAIANLSALPVVGDILKYADTRQQNADYMKNKDIDWSQVKYPALNNLTGTSYLLNAVRGGTNFVSKNIDSLYSDGKENRRK